MNDIRHEENHRAEVIRLRAVADAIEQRDNLQRLYVQLTSEQDDMIIKLVSVDEDTQYDPRLYSEIHPIMSAIAEEHLIEFVQEALLRAEKQLIAARQRLSEESQRP